LAENHQIYGHKQCIYTVLANPMCFALALVAAYRWNCDKRESKLGFAQVCLADGAKLV
jgi:hypothetical protein